MMNVIKSAVFIDLCSATSRADGHWEVILALKSAAPCRCRYLEVEPSDSQLVEKAVKALY